MPTPPPVSKAQTGKVQMQGQTASEFGSDPNLEQEFVKGEPKELHP